MADPAQRPTDEQYLVFHHLVQELIRVDHDQAAALADHPFRVTDVWFSAILARADDALGAIAELAGRPDDAARHRGDADRTRVALDAAWDLGQEQCGELDHVSGQVLYADTVARFAPLLAGCDLDRAAVLVERLFGPGFAGTAGMRWPLPPSTASTDPAFDPRAYWRGPHWPPMTWLLWLALAEGGHRRSAQRLRAAGLAQLRAVGCHEYVEPFSGEGLGSSAQSWSAAVALDWLADEPEATDRRRQPS